MNHSGSKSDFLNYRGISPSDIPNIDVYMDQLLTFFETSYGFLRRDRSESILTKAMINNYVKAGVMDKPIKKKYNKHQVKKLIMIYHLKLVLAIHDIEKLLRHVGHTELSTDDFYERFLMTEAAAYEELASRYLETFTQETDQEELINTILTLATEACAKKRLAEKLLDKLTEPPSQP